MDKNFNIPIKYSQNFLKSGKLIKNLIDRSSIGINDTVLEIGPGNGKITQNLLEICKKVVAVEKDVELYTKLQTSDFGQLSVKNHKLTLIHADFLNYRIDFTDYKVFSNIPFSISSEIISKLFFSENPPIDSYLILQKEVADKLLGENGESMFSAILKSAFRPSIVHIFNKNDFEPIPSVTPVLVNIEHISDNNIDSEYVDFIAYCFTQWKPNLKEIFKKLFTYNQFNVLTKLYKINFNLSLTSLTIDQWSELFTSFKKFVAPEKKTLIIGAYQKYLNDRNKMRKNVKPDWRERNKNEVLK
jgi:23S rRNA (adenine-N6)-dimethyltransferase